MATPVPVLSAPERQLEAAKLCAKAMALLDGALAEQLIGEAHKVECLEMRELMLEAARRLVLDAAEGE